MNVRLTKYSIIFSIICIFSSVSPDIQTTLQQAFDIGVQAYIYAYPLVLMDITKQLMTTPIKNSPKPINRINKFINIGVFPTELFKDIVRPNIDTLYSFAWLDLLTEPLVLTVPDTHGRYYLLQVLDAWTNVCASIGKRTSGTTAQSFALVGPNWQGKLPKGIKKVRVPTNMALIIGRTQTNGKSDFESVHKIQAGYALTPLSLWQKKITLPSDFLYDRTAIGKRIAPVDQVSLMDAKQFYTIFSRALKNNLPPKCDQAMVRLLEKIGIVPGKDFDSASLPAPIMHALNEAIVQAKKTIMEKKFDIKTVNGWSLMPHIGVYGTDYLMRAFIAQIGIGANIPKDAIYPTAFVDGAGNRLNGTHNYLLHFDKDQLPPVNAFWSITMYNAKSFLEKNEIDRFGLGDRDALTFNDDGSLDIYIQHAAPDKNKLANWLPSPPADFSLTMRLYWPKKSVLKGKWHPKVVQNTDNSMRS